MFLNILVFELRYRLKRPATYIYFFILFAMAFLFITTDVISIGGSNGNVFRNSPYTINQVVLILGVFAAMICSAMMGVPVFRDFDNRFHEIYFSTPISKTAYLFGRFFGSYIITLLVFSGIIFGLMIGAAMPFLEQSEIASFHFASYVQPFVTIIVPNILFMGAIFFTVGTLTINLFAIYVQGILFLILYIISGTLMENMDNQFLGAMLDPIGITASSEITKFWTPAQRNERIIPLVNELLYNRILWTLIGLVIFAIGYKLFSFSAQPISIGKKKLKVLVEENKSVKIELPVVSQSFTFFNTLKQFFTIAAFESKLIFKSPLFIVLVLFGVFNICGNIFGVSYMYGTDAYPHTSNIVANASQTFALFFIIIITFYVGELVWRERGFKINQIADALPIGNYTLLFGKFLSMLLVLAFLNLIIIATCLSIQLIKGYTHFELLLYFKYLFGINYIDYVFLVMLSFFVHSLVNHKFIGHAVVIGFYIVNIVLSVNGFEHNLYQPGSSPRVILSDMNGFGHFLNGKGWFQFYWFLFGCLLLIFTASLWVRGTESTLSSRFKIAINRYTLKSKIISVGFVVLLFICGSFIYKNTNVLNTYLPKNEYRVYAASLERKYKKYTGTKQPRIISVNNVVDIFPHDRKAVIKGTWWLKNKNTVAVDTIIYNLTEKRFISEIKILFSKANSEILADDSAGIYMVKLKEPMLPGDSIKMDFSFVYQCKGFSNDGNEFAIVDNGTFINNGLLPQFGYLYGNELSEPDDRKKEKLPIRPKSFSIYDTTKYGNSYVSNDADWIDFETTVSTVADQIAISPGYLQKEWVKDNRRYFYYKMDAPILNFYSYLSAVYEVKKDKWKDVNIEIYYHKDHEYNIENMVSSIKESLDYYSKNFGVYQHKQARIIEFPKYASFAQAFPNTIPFSESIGFILDVTDQKAIDAAFYVTAHEMAHQWWAHQVVGCPVDGMTVFSETMSQYSALMIMKKHYGNEKMKKFLQYELQDYLSARGSEKDKEQPLLYNQNQPYLHYQKGSVVMFALQDYIGEDKVNLAAKNFIEKYKFGGPPYPTSLDFYSFLKQQTPDSLKETLADLFERITIFDNRCTNATITEMPHKRYQVTLDLTVHKYYADSIGNEKEVKLNEWMDVGAVDEDNNLLFSKKVHIKNNEQSITFLMDKKPFKAGIDPINKLVDKDVDDNLKTLN